ncbi:melanophilin isoform X1 [Haplochromis burtoni]|uniref:Melanophilin n=1 Tax=Haplochromis burtoni TaxID=8153 RepID=A0A3Q2V042_HAPBU|nr:melanophilin isoform X1 [Haplochromis burtoni]
MPGSTAGKKLDLSKLTDEEAQHVWEVVQRDFDLRKKEEDRLGDLKTKVEREDTKKELLGNQTSLTESHCIRCLQPFKFLLNNKHQCLDCQLYICKSCGRYNKKEDGWVCDTCHMTRVLKIGTLEWYHENVRARFKRFGSAKVMRSLFRRFDGEGSRSQSDLGEPREYDTQSMPEVHNAYGEHSMDATDSQQHRRMKKVKRRLTVDPIDFKLDVDYLSQSRGPSNEEPGDPDIMVMDVGGRESMLAEADMATVFHQIMDEQHKELDLEITPQQDDLVYSDSRTIPSRSISRLSYSSCGSGSIGGPRCSSSVYLPGLEDSEEEEDEHCQPYPLYQLHSGLCRQTSQDSLSSANHPPQITDINRRMSAIETLLNRLEQKVTSTYDQTSPTPSSTSPLPQWNEVDLEEQQLRQRLHEMTDNISDHSLTSDDEDEPERPHSSQEILAWRSPQADPRPSKLPIRPTSRASIVVSRLEEEQPQQTESLKANDSSESLERKGHPLEEGSKASFKGSTALLVELEDKVAQAAANVQNAQSEVSDIESRIAALNAAGMSSDKKRKSAIPIQARRLSYNFPTNQVDRFTRNSLYRGSLTQRNPVAKAKTRAACAKPVMTQGS